MRHSERFWLDCACEKSDIDSAAGSEELGFRNFGEYVEIYNLNFVPDSGFDSVDSEIFPFPCARQSDSLCHYVED